MKNERGFTLVDVNCSIDYFSAYFSYYPKCDETLCFH